LDSDNSEISSIDELIDSDIPTTRTVNDEANMLHQDSLIEPINDSTGGDDLNKDACSVEVEDVTILLPHPIKQGLRKD
jgi:hypothetical protein